MHPSITVRYGYRFIEHIKQTFSQRTPEKQCFLAWCYITLFGPNKEDAKNPITKKRRKKRQMKPNKTSIAVRFYCNQIQRNPCNTKKTTEWMPKPKWKLTV